MRTVKTEIAKGLIEKRKEFIKDHPELAPYAEYIPEAWQLGFKTENEKEFLTIQLNIRVGMKTTVKEVLAYAPHEAGIKVLEAVKTEVDRVIHESVRSVLFKITEVVIGELKAKAHREE